jgi:hypothetical protein
MTLLAENKNGDARPCALSLLKDNLSASQAGVAEKPDKYRFKTEKNRVIVFSLRYVLTFYLWVSWINDFKI